MSATNAINSKKRQMRMGGGALKFPLDLDSMPYYTQITFVKYHRELPNRPHTQSTTGSILLPIPTRMPENYHLDYQGMAMNWRGMNNGDAAQVWSQIKNAGGDIANWFNSQKIAQTGVFDWDNVLAAAMDATEPNSKLLAWIMGVMPKNMIDTPIGRAAANYLGKVPNPHMTTVFNGVNLRELTFEWQFSPKSEQESKELRDIMSAIKGHAHPTYDHRVARFALNYPDQCYIEFKGLEDYVEPVNKCIIRDIMFENAPNGPSFYKGGAPVAVQMSLTVQEVEIRTREDWDEGVQFDGSSITGNAWPQVGQGRGGE